MSTEGFIEWNDGFVPHSGGGLGDWSFMPESGLSPAFWDQALALVNRPSICAPLSMIRVV
jgi:hypothetical protein